MGAKLPAGFGRKRNGSFGAVHRGKLPFDHSTATNPFCPVSPVRMLGMTVAAEGVETAE
jgi:hypothetical protein